MSLSCHCPPICRTSNIVLAPIIPLTLRRLLLDLLFYAGCGFISMQSCLLPQSFGLLLHLLYDLLILPNIQLRSLVPELLFLSNIQLRSLVSNFFSLPNIQLRSLVSEWFFFNFILFFVFAGFIK
jgi:hypothetical protein